MILDVQVLRSRSVDEVAGTIGRLVEADLGEDRYGNPAIAVEGHGLVLVARSTWDPTVTYAEVHSDDSRLAEHVYELLEANTDWPIELVDSSDDHPEDVTLRSRY